MRRLLRSIANGEEITQDVSTLENPAILEQLRGLDAGPAKRPAGAKQAARAQVRQARRQHPAPQGPAGGQQACGQGARQAGAAPRQAQRPHADAAAPGARRRTTPRGRTAPALKLS